MSVDEIHRTREKESVLFVGIAEDSLDRATKLLAGIPDGVYRAVGSALKRAAAHGQTVGAKIVSEEYAIGQNELKRHVKNINRIVKDGKSSYEVTFGYKGWVIPLLKFDTVIDRQGRVSARVVRSGTRKALDHAFRAHMGPHVGIYERIGPDRFPVRELYGPATPQLFYEGAEGEAYEKMDKEIRDAFEKRIDREILRVLNGWGGR
jgi:hypothetical protein